jgi:hypothetical protein
MGPNPARLSAELGFTLREPMRAGFRLLDIPGRELRTSPVEPYPTGEHTIDCPLRDVRPGLYFLRFEHGGEADLARLIVSR